MDTSDAKAMLFWENYANTIAVSDLATQWARESPAKVNNMQHKRDVSYLRNDFNCMHHLSVNKW